MNESQVVSLLAAISLSMAHLFSGKLRFLGGTPRSIWLSIAGGVSVAYVFVHLLPELAEAQEAVGEALGESLRSLENHVYLIALVGLAFFYGVERTASGSRKDGRGKVDADAGDSQASGAGSVGRAPASERGEERATSTGVFWLSVVSFAFYNAVVGYLLLHRIDESFRSLFLFSLAMLLHFIVNDYGLRERHKEDYSRIGRWILSAAVFLGWSIAVVTDIPEYIIALLISFLAGGIVLNVLKEELPEARRSRFGPFAAGAAAYAALLLTF